MARKPRFNLIGIPQHVIQRGNNREPCFFAEEDFQYYLECLQKSAEKFGCLVHAYVLMTNHVHLLITPQVDCGVSQLMQSIGRKYVRYINSQYCRTGTLWEGRYKSSLVDSENYLLTCMQYIELNPVRASMVAVPEEYKWSSYQYNGGGSKNGCITEHPVFTGLGKTRKERCHAYRSIFPGYLDYTQLHEIRKTLNQELVLGNHYFKERIETMTKRQVFPGKPGRPRVEEAGGNYFVY